MDFDYKKYSLENLENWMHDAMSSGGASPQEIYDVIVNVVKENYYTYKHQTSQAYELLSLLNSGIDNNKYQDYLNKVLSCDKDDPSEQCKKSWTSFWEDKPSQEEYKGSTVSSVQYTEEELNAMCDKAESDQEKEQCREYNLREAEYYDKRAELDAKYSNHYYDYTRNDPNRKNPFLTYDEAITAGYEMTADGFWIPPNKEDKVVKWQLPVEMHPSGEYYVLFPDDLLEAANLKEGDQVEWNDNNNGSYTLRKVADD